MLRSHYKWPRASLPGFRLVTPGYCCCQTACTTPVPTRGRPRPHRPDPRPLAARLPRLDVLLDATGEQDRWLGGELARLGRGKFRVAAGYRDVAPALSSFFAELRSPLWPSSSSPP